MRNREAERVVKGVVVASRFQCLLLVGWSNHSAIMTTVRTFEVHGVLRGGVGEKLSTFPIIS